MQKDLLNRLTQCGYDYKNDPNIKPITIKQEGTFEKDQPRDEEPVEETAPNVAAGKLGSAQLREPSRHQTAPVGFRAGTATLASADGAGLSRARPGGL